MRLRSFSGGADVRAVLSAELVLRGVAPHMTDILLCLDPTPQQIREWGQRARHWDGDKTACATLTALRGTLAPPRTESERNVELLLERHAAWMTEQIKSSILGTGNLVALGFESARQSIREREFLHTLPTSVFYGDILHVKPSTSLPDTFGASECDAAQTMLRIVSQRPINPWYNEAHTDTLCGVIRSVIDLACVVGDTVGDLPEQLVETLFERELNMISPALIN